MPVHVKAMCAKKLDGFSSSNSTFWRQSSGARPGRVNQTKSSAGGGGGPAAAAHSFQHFQDSVSDAWDIEEPLTPTVKKSEKLVEDPPVHKDGITPTHSTVQVRGYRYAISWCSTQSEISTYVFFKVNSNIQGQNTTNNLLFFSMYK